MASCQASVLSYQSRRVLEGRGCGIDSTYMFAWARAWRLVCFGTAEMWTVENAGLVKGWMRGCREWVLRCWDGVVLATSKLVALSVFPYRLAPRIGAYFIVFLQPVMVVKISADDTKDI